MLDDFDRESDRISFLEALLVLLIMLLVIFLLYVAVDGLLDTLEHTINRIPDTSNITKDYK